MSDVSGHVFVVRGDLLRFACDAIVVPTDRSGRIEQPWVEHLERLGVHVVPASWDPKGGGWLREEDRERIGGPVGPEERLPRTWLLATATSARDSREHVDGDTGREDVRCLEDTLEAFARRFARSQQGGEQLGGRGCPLVAIPLLGSGEGGFRKRFRHFARELLSILQRAASAGGVRYRPDRFR